MVCCQRTYKSEQARKAIEKGKIEWQMWANSLGVLGGCLYVIGGAIIASDDFGTQWVAWYGIAVGLFVFSVEWPRSKRKRGRTLPRTYQEYFVPLVKRMPLLNILFVRFVLYTMLAIPGFFELPTVLAGAVLVFSGIVYAIAAFKGEEWKPLVPQKRPTGPQPKLIVAPTSAPPRLPTAGGAGAAPQPERKREAPKTEITENKTFVRDPVIPQPKPRATNPTAPSRAPPRAPSKVPPRAPRPAPAPKPKPVRWLSAKDAEGNLYYVNEQTQETQWERPNGTVVPYEEMAAI